jgi:16S rRNA (uracil1498-N3)-methyltransferase
MHHYPKIRLFTTAHLQQSTIIDLQKEQAHYLVNVMRKKQGDSLLIFNGVDGEWLANITASGKKHCQVTLHEKTRQQKPQPDVWLCFAPVKNSPITNIVQKATELGASMLQPVITQHTIVNKINGERLGAIAIESAEQSERITVPAIMGLITLDKLLASWDGTRKLILCDESGQCPPMPQVLAKLNKGDKYAILIGPEGGFSMQEFALLKKQPYVISVGMGPRILRADTAAIVALASVFSILGDWDEKPNFRN